MSQKQHLDRVLEILEINQVELCARLNIKHYSQVNSWFTDRRPVSPKYAREIERLTEGQVKASDLRPDIFGELSTSAA